MTILGKSDREEEINKERARWRTHTYTYFPSSFFKNQVFHMQRDCDDQKEFKCTIFLKRL
jgi:hypothetical protein